MTDETPASTDSTETIPTIAVPLPPLRSRFAAASGRRTTKLVSIPGIGVVRIRSLTEAEWQQGISHWFRDEDLDLIADRKKYDRAKLVQMCLINDDDSLVFTDAIEDLDVIVGLGAAIVYPLWDAANDLNRPPKN
jgi:hypothetical protein